MKRDLWRVSILSEIDKSSIVAGGWRGGGGWRLPYKRNGDARRLALGCKLQILVSLRVFGWKVTILLIDVSLSVLKEIYKKCPNADHTKIYLHNHIGLPAYGFNLNFPASLPSLLVPSRAIGCVFRWSLANGEINE